MPTYAYRCADCGHAFDIYQQFSDDALTECPKCDGTLRKVFGSIGVTFSGSGFYRTDSRAESKAASAGKPADPGGSNGSGSASNAASTSNSGSSTTGSSHASGSSSSSSSSGSSGSSD